MKKRRSGSMLEELFRKLAPTIGAKIVMEPEWRVVGQIIFKNGRKRYFRDTTIDLNPVGSSDIAKDKDYATFFMKKLGYPTITGKTFFSARWSKAIGSPRNVDAAYRYAKKLGFPVIVKPNNGSQGVGVAKAYTKADFYRAMSVAFAWDRVVIVQRPVPGKDYRIVVLDGEVISAYERTPLCIVGDGKLRVRQLLQRKQKQFIVIGRDTMIKSEDPRIGENLKRQNLNMSSVLPRDRRIYLLDNANLSTGGDALDVTNVIHPAFKKIAVKLTRDMGLRMCGVDLMVDGDIAHKPARYWVLEINAAPGLDHYLKSGRAQQKIVEDLYLKVLKAME